MSSPVVIRAENVSKRYVISHLAKQQTIRDAMHHGLRLLWRRLRWQAKHNREEFWALKDVSFEVKQGEVLGVIGRNGAGKSTLLKILSRITEPTTGRIAINGRLASLLEVGTGFHPELTGRENIFLNGAILGMTRTEIRSRLDEIVSFAEIAKFLDTPVKRYSSGMYVRLAFAVAAHLEPDILIVDEVLAVGDSHFQKKCLGKMKQAVQTSSRTVIFVSHDMSAITALCKSTLFLDAGKVQQYDITAKSIESYFSSRQNTPVSYNAPLQSRTPNRPHVGSITIITSQSPGIQAAGKPMTIKLEINHTTPVNGACLSFQIINQYNQPATHLWIFDSEEPFARTSGRTILTCQLPILRLNVGHYTLRVNFSEPPGGTHFETLDEICHFEVVQIGDTTLWGWRSETCVYRESHEWRTERLA